jgi:ATP-binding protein involved in chromosome partitioning
LHFRCIEAIQQVYPSADVHVHMEKAQTSGGNPQLPQVKNIIAVASGKGGVGKSTVAVNLALGLQRQGAKVGLIDADLYGPSIPTMLGLTGHRPKVVKRYGQNKILPLEAFDLSVMSIGFIVEPEKAVVLRGPRLAGIIKQFLYECLWPELDYLVIDLPPGTGDIQLTLVQTVPVTGAIIVTTPQQVAIADALKALNMFRMENINVPVLGVVENMAWFTPAELPDNKYYVFGQGGGESLAEMGDTLVLGQIPLIQSVGEDGDRGNPSILSTDSSVNRYFVDLADAVARQIRVRNERLAPTEIVQKK